MIVPNNKIFGGKQDKTQQEQSGTKTEDVPEEQQDAQSQTRISYQKRKVYALQSISHKFEKIEGINGRCEQLLPFADGLLAGTFNELYYVRGEDEVTKVYQGTSPQHIIPFKDSLSLLIATQSGIIKAYQEDGQWKTTDYITDINEPVYSLAFHEKSGTLWAGSENKAYKISFAWDGKVSNIQRI